MSSPRKRSKGAGRGGSSTIFTGPELVTESQIVFSPYVNATYVVDHRPDAKVIRPVGDGFTVTAFDEQQPPPEGFEDHAFAFNTGDLLVINPAEIAKCESDFEIARFAALAKEFAIQNECVLVTSSMLAVMRVRPGGIPVEMQDGKRYFAFGTLVDHVTCAGPNKWVCYMHWCDSLDSDYRKHGESYGWNVGTNPFSILQVVSPRQHRVLMIRKDKLFLFQDPMYMKAVQDGRDLRHGWFF